MNKFTLITHIINYLQHELSECELAANNAHLAAIDEQSKAETQYDTLAIESAYLAEGQSRRIAEFKLAIKRFEVLNQLLQQQEITPPLPSSPVTKLGSLVQLNNEVAIQHWFFITPAAGGFKTTVDEQAITLVTPESPMGEALMGKQIDDDIEVTLGNHMLSDYIVNIA